ncbi:acyl carrier protein [Streptomyces pilosus]|uniref:Uncharacterized protein n=1 Tax=Streptomyces pilosus TaxID=28893 RepID=A0A918F397_9ACTN|nr:acyl carrier protein [Streptomyces pilosus]GGR00729.1 hypothetical protein GCM10010280_55810 [Streptomyces pilosus]
MTAPAAPCVRTGLLDCVQVNLAVLADRRHGPGRHLALGARLRFRPEPGPDGLPTVDPPPERHLREGAALVGLRPDLFAHRVPAGGLRAMAEGASAVYAVADSYDMPWLPYAGRAHMEHGFLAGTHGDGAEVEDAYDNETAWGPARPGRWTFPWERLPTASFACTLSPVPGYRPPRPELCLDDAAAYVEAYTAHPDRLAALRRLTAETWLLTRARHLHAAYRAHLGERMDAEDHLRRWDRLTSTAFIAQRRAERGKPAPAALLPELASLLTADREVFAVRPH